MWWSRPTDPASRVSRYWNARGDGQEAAAHQADLDPSLLAAIDLLYATDDTHDPDPVVLDRMERTLMNTIALSPSRYATVAVPAAGRNGRVTPLAPLTPPAPLPRVGERRHGLFGAVATAAIVVLVVIASLAIVHPDRRAPLAPAPALLPAVSGTPALPDTPGVSTAPLLTVTIPALSGEAAYVAIERYTLPAATALHVDLRDGHAPGVFFVEEGTLTLRVLEGPDPVRIVRGGSVPKEESSAIGASADLAGGDAVVVPEGGNADLQNLSSQPARVLYLLEPDNLLPPEGDPGVSGETLIGGVHTLTAPLTLTLQRVTLAPEASLPGIDAKDVVQLSTPVDQERVMDARKGSNGSLRNAGDDPLEAYVLTVTPSLAAATPAA